MNPEFRASVENNFSEGGLRTPRVLGGEFDGASGEMSESAKLTPGLLQFADRLSELPRLNMKVLREMSEAWDNGSSTMPEQFVEAFNKCFWTGEVERELAELSQSELPADRLSVHNILDFLEAWGFEVNNQTAGEFDEEMQNIAFGFGPNTVVDSQIAKSAAEIYESTDNFALAEHWSDIYVTFRDEWLNAYSPDAISGVPGGNSEAVKYKYAHAPESYQLRRYLNITEGDVIENPVLPVAPGVAGYYERGRLRRLFHCPDAIVPMPSDEQSWRAANDPADEWIYEELARVTQKAGGAHADRALYVLQDWNNFSRDAEARNFYFDVERKVAVQESWGEESVSVLDVLHPFVRAEILRYNLSQAEKRQDHGRRPVEMSREEFFRRIFPHKTASEEEQYLALYSQSLSMRYKLEKGSRFYLSQLPAYAQGELDTWLENASKEDIRRLGNAVLSNETVGKEILISFLACAENPENAEVILQVAEQADLEAGERVFRTYANMVEASEHLNSLARNAFSDIEISENVRHRVIGDLFAKANNLLKKAAEGGDPKMLLKSLEAYSGTAALYAGMAQELAKEGKASIAEIMGSKVEVIDSGDILDEDKNKLLAVFASGRKKAYPSDMQSKSLEKFERKLRESGHTFYILRLAQEPVVFFHADPDSNSPDRIHLGGFNLSPNAEKGPWAVAFIKSWIERNKTKELYAEVLAENEIAARFYMKSLGFREDRRSMTAGETGILHEYIHIVRAGEPVKAQ